MSSILLYVSKINELDLLIPAAERFAQIYKLNEVELLYVEGEGDTATYRERIKKETRGALALSYDISELPVENSAKSLGAYIDRNKHQVLLGVFHPSFQNNALLYPIFVESSIHTILLWPQSRVGMKRVGVLATGGVNDPKALVLAKDGLREGEKVQLLMLEEDHSFNYEIVGKQAIDDLLDESGVTKDQVKARVECLDADYESLNYFFNKVDLLLTGAENAKDISNWNENKRFPVVGLVKRAPKMAVAKKYTQWIPHLSPRAYADLILGLRRGSLLTADFMVMLGLAAAIASFGLLQDSAAIVIGSMLLAPLMTPMIGCGLALVQANARLGLKSSKTIAVGVLLTIGVSFLVGFITPGQELTSEVVSRGVPNILDLFVALFAACAAAYALARPNIGGAVAGVAIATALVPPLCSVGIALAYGKFPTAFGAFLLFTTNLVAIILGASITFNILGINSMQVHAQRNTWVYKAIGALATILVVFAVPLGLELERNIKLGKPTPNLYPVAKNVTTSIIHYIETLPDVELLLHGRPGSEADPTDVMIILASSVRMPKVYIDELTRIVRRQMGDENLIIEVHALRDGWRDLTLEKRAEKILQKREDLFEEKIKEKFEGKLEQEVEKQVEKGLDKQVEKQIEKKINIELEEKIEKEVKEELKHELKKPKK
ncbi:TIGR00341 family protein [Lentisphaera profundi]|uniref:TIGR00341 family protein n=1 Tax=Lentisphaera profundi TaxID=1658616 RepID=A0ABY7VP01_9BACT|nr:TIGR00341 family protein [Lentisphaera profundi]WDE95870.1 TIGR00341 family protein [Lentisphaera profundi]